MHIEIPGDAEQLLLRNAQRAGYDDVREYILNLILANAPEEISERSDANDPRILSALEAGYRGGTAGDGKKIVADIRAQLSAGPNSAQDCGN